MSVGSGLCEIVYLAAEHLLGCFLYCFLSYAQDSLFRRKWDANLLCAHNLHLKIHMFSYAFVVE